MKKSANRGLFLGLIVIGGIFLSLQPNAEALTTAGHLQLNINSASNKPIQLTEKGQEQKSDTSKESGDKIKGEIENVVSEGSLFSATAYCLRGKTASGAYVRRGIVAADPRVIPLGSTITVSAGQYSGTYVVADTGGVIKGKKIDIWVPSCSEAIKFGRRKIKVAVNKKEVS